MLEEMEQYSTVCGGMAITKQEKEGRKYQVSKKKKGRLKWLHKPNTGNANRRLILIKQLVIKLPQR